MKKGQAQASKLLEKRLISCPCAQDAEVNSSVCLSICPSADVSGPGHFSRWNLHAISVNLHNEISQVVHMHRLLCFFLYNSLCVCVSIYCISVCVLVCVVVHVHVQKCTLSCMCVHVGV